MALFSFLSYVTVYIQTHQNRNNNALFKSKQIDCNNFSYEKTPLSFFFWTLFLIPTSCRSLYVCVFNSIIKPGLFIERFFGGQLRLVASEALSFLENPWVFLEKPWVFLKILEFFGKNLEDFFNPWIFWEIFAFFCKELLKISG